MRRFAELLKAMFVVTDQQSFLASSDEITLHDALRICAPAARQAAATTAINVSLPQVQVCWYRSESDLLNQWRHLDHVPPPAVNRTVVLILGSFLQGNLRELVRRRHPADRLVIVPHAGYWPGTSSFGDLALASAALGWKSIEIRRGFQDAPENIFSSSGKHERLFVVLPVHAQASSVA